MCRSRSTPVADMHREVTRLLAGLKSGGPEARAELAAAVYQELHDMARRLMRNERADHTMQATALVHEAFMRLFGGSEPQWDDRRHFFAVAATAMRRVLVDYARARGAGKRGGELQRVNLDESAVVGHDHLDQVIAIDQALARLALLDARQSRIVELRFFTGLSEEEIAELLQVSARTVKRDWRLARVWLHGELADTPVHAPPVRSHKSHSSN